MKKKVKPIQVPKDLQDQVNAVRMLALTYNLLQQAPFPIGHAKAVNDASSFVKALHEQAMKQAQTHPESNLIPELKAE